MPEPKFDIAEANRYFAAHCFNRAWDLIDKDSRTPEEDRLMVLLNQASIWHWTQREDCTKRNLSIGYWQAARIFALLNDAENARRAAQLSMENTSQDEPFYLGYAHEAMARAELVAGNHSEAKRLLDSAHHLHSQVTDDEEKEMLGKDLLNLTSELP